MKPSYITLVGTTPFITNLNNNNEHFNVSIRASANVLTEIALEDTAPSTTPGGFPPRDDPHQGSPGPTWVAAPAAGANGIINLTYPVRLVRFTPIAGGTVTILQQGLN